MTGGIGFSRFGKDTFNKNFKLLHKHLPFFKQKKNRFVNPPKLNIEVTEEQLSELQKIKKQQKRPAEILIKWLFIFCGLLTLMLLIVVAIGYINF